MEEYIMRELTIGGTQIVIAEDYCKGKTAEDVQKILDKAAETASRHCNIMYNV